MLKFIKSKEFLVGVLIGVILYYTYETYGDLVITTDTTDTPETEGK